MEILSQDAGDDWTCDWYCTKCKTFLRAHAQDLEADSFKVSGHHFAGTAVCERKLYLVCPVCKNVEFLTEGQAATVPYLLNQQGEAHYAERREREYSNPTQ